MCMKLTMWARVVSNQYNVKWTIKPLEQVLRLPANWTAFLRTIAVISHAYRHDTFVVHISELFLKKFLWYWDGIELSRVEYEGYRKRENRQQYDHDVVKCVLWIPHTMTLCSYICKSSITFGLELCSLFGEENQYCWQSFSSINGTSLTKWSKTHFLSEERLNSSKKLS